VSQAQQPNPAELYERYFGAAIFKPWTEKLMAYAQPQAGERVLDLACGTGIVSRRVAPLVGKQGQVVGVDNNPQMLEVAEAVTNGVGRQVEYQEGDAVDLPLPDGQFDLVICQQGLQFFSDYGAAMAEMERVLADGGRVVISVWKGLEHHPVYKELLEAEAQYLNAPLAKVARPFSFPGEETLERLLQQSGFDRLQIWEESMNVRFPEPQRFVQLTVLAGAAVVPEFAQQNPEERSALIEAVAAESETVLQEYGDGEWITFPMPTYIAVTRAA
jgi:ubiquinone/menaquinone biosynthesis C-methylase UbiE